MMCFYKEITDSIKNLSSNHKNFITNVRNFLTKIIKFMQDYFSKILKHGLFYKSSSVKKLVILKVKFEGFSPRMSKLTK